MAEAQKQQKKKIKQTRHKSAIKRNRQNKVRRAHNKAALATMATAIKKIKAAVLKKDANSAKEALTQAVSLIDRASQKKLIHHKNAARKISRLTVQVNTLS
ncbi:MAG: 30S ribosomal protein S20 [Deltaproteobacteria bacterium]|nr:30S ribosomal protein S20 [Deltaproteobacteria bacterium]